MKSRLYEKYTKDVVPALREKRKYQNVHQIPRLEKIVVNMGVSASLEKGAIDDTTIDSNSGVLTVAYSSTDSQFAGLLTSPLFQQVVVK